MAVGQIYRVIDAHTPSKRDSSEVQDRKRAKISSAEVRRIERSVWRDGRLDGEECVGLMELLAIFGERNQTGEPHHFARVGDARRLTRGVLSILASEAAFRSLPRRDQRTILSEGLEHSESVGVRVMRRHASEDRGLSSLRVPSSLRRRLREAFALAKSEAERATGVRFREHSINLHSFKRGRETYGHQLDIYFTGRSRAYAAHFTLSSDGAILERSGGSMRVERGTP
jgi:hypothetical protein